MVTTVREVERKYELAADGVVPDFGALPGLSVAAGAEDEALTAVYFDTPDLRLAAAGITLRRRTGGPDEGWHLKIPAGPDTRDEIRRPLDPDDIPEGTAVPGELAGLVALYTRGAEPAQIARIHTTRTRWVLSDDDGGRAELVLDRVRAWTPQQPWTSRDWQEIEVELLAGSHRLLDRVDRWLADSGVRRAAAPSKLAHLLGDRLPAGPGAAAATRLRPGTAAGVVLRSYLAEQLERLRALDPRVRRDAPDAVHQMRVTTRRLRAALRTYRALLDADRAAHARAELAWLAAVLGEVRDAEVLAARLDAEAAALADLLPAEPEPAPSAIGPAARAGTAVAGPVAHPGSAAATPAVEPGLRPAGVSRGTSAREAESARAAIARYFTRLHAAVFAELSAQLATPRYFALIDELTALVTATPDRPEARRPARTALPKAVARTEKRLRRAVAAIDDTGGHERDVAIHESRKAAKRARYAAELASLALGKDARRFARRMKALQDLLGEHQDAVVGRAELELLAAEPELAEVDRFLLGVLYGREVDHGIDIEHELPRYWSAASARRVHRWLR